jgi:protein involved in polysaccharide export with SLBB domain
MLRILVVLAVLVLGNACNPNRVTPAVFREVCRDLAEGGGDEGGTNVQARVITPGMQLGVYVAEDSSLNRPYVVPQGCAVEFAAVGRMRVCGLTTDELAAKIKAILERDYFQKATVEVTIESVFSRAQGGPSHAGVIYILGGVGRPGPMRLPFGEFTVTKAIIAAGGFSLFGDGGKVKIVRYCQDGRKYETYLNVASIMRRGDFEKDVPLRDNDWVIVPQKKFSFF